MSAVACRPAGDDRFNALVLIAFIAVAVFGAWQHAMWRDEMQAFLIARNSASLPELIRNLRYDGHPILWYLLIWPGARLTWDPASMQPVSLAVSTAGVALFLWCGPWTRLEKLLWPFGYYLLFECTIKNRAYCVGTMLLMVFCALWPHRRRQMPAMGLVLGLIANTHTLFGFLSLAGGLALLVDRLWRDGWRGLWIQPARDLTAVLAYTALALMAAFVAAPPASGDWAGLTPVENSGIWLGVGRVAVALSQIAFPFGVLLGRFGYSAETVIAVEQAGLILSLWIVPVFLAGLLSTPPAAAMLLCGILPVGLVFLITYGGGAQHAGTLLLALTAALWIARRSGDEGQARPTIRLTRTLFPAILASHAATGFAIVALHSVVPYSDARAVARFIAAQGWAAQPVAGVSDSLVAVCGYLHAPTCYYADRGRWSSFIVYDGRPGGGAWVQSIPPEDMSRLSAAAGVLGPNVTFLVPDAWTKDTDMLARHGFRLVAHFRHAAEDNFQVLRKGN